MSTIDKQEARNRAERAAEQAERLRLAAEHLTTAAALISAAAWDMVSDERRVGLGLTISGARDRARHLARETARWAADERAESERQAKAALPLELWP